MSTQIATRRYEKLKIKIENWWEDRFAVGEALREIQADKLYLVEYATFEDFTEKAFEIKRSYAYRLIEAAEVKHSLRMSPIGDKLTTESQARALKVVPEAERAEVLTITAERGPVTAKAITETVAQTAKPKPTPATIAHFDKMGFPIPDEIYPDWLKAEEFNEALRDIQRIKLAVKNGIKDDNYILFAELNNSIVSAIQNVYVDLALVLPYAVCTTCQGKGRANCAMCRRRGFLSKFKFDTAVPENLRKLREMQCRH